MLQGTLDVFSLDEVLGLLSGASKSGVLNINGDRGVGAISIADGQLVGGSASCAPEVTDLPEVVFELLRFQDEQTRMVWLKRVKDEYLKWKRKPETLT